MPSTGSPPMRQYWSIQYLRAAAAIAVILFHQYQDRPGPLRFGDHGVDLFFVISGFIMTALTDRREVTPKRFLLDRIARIAPLYWMATLLAFALTAAGVQLYGCSDDPGLLLRSLIFVPAYNPDGQVWPTLFLGWTLNFEMFFYLVFALALFAPTAWRLPLMTLAFGVLIALGAMLDPQGAVLRTYTSPMLAEFLAGAFIGKVMTAQRIGPAAYALLAAPAAALAALSMAFEDLLFGAGAAALVAAGLLVERGGGLPRSRVLKFLGDASYSLYLFQQFAFDAVGIVTIRLHAKTGVDLTVEWVRKPLAVAAAIALGVFVYWFVERPLTAAARRGLSKLAHTPARLSPAAAD